MSSSGTSSDTLYGEKDEIAAAELKSLKPTAAVYERKASIFFLSSKEQALESIEQRKAATKDLKKEAKQ